MSNLFRILSLVLFLSISILSPLRSFAGADGKPAIADLAGKWKEAGTFFNAGEYGTFKSGARNVAFRIFYRSENKRSVVIFPGFGEAPQKYVELIYDFNQRGYNVFVLSHQGMGESQRVLANPQIMHIEPAAKYYADADYFLDKVVAPRLHGQPVYLYSHSFGGLVAAHTLTRRPEFFAKAIFSAPMFEMNLHGYSRFSAYLVGNFRSSTSYAPGFKDWDARLVTFADQTVTGSQTRWWYINQMMRRNPQLWQGGPSTGWVMQMLDATEPGKIETLAKQARIPVLLLQAGDDTYVMPGGHDIYVKNAADATLIQFPLSRHEIHQERDFIRTRALKAIFEFYEE